MIWWGVFAAIFVGIDAVSKLNRDHPRPVAWFEAGLTVVIVIGCIVAYVVRGDDD